MNRPELRSNQRTVAARIADELRERILDGDLPTGSRLQQNDLAKQFDVSSTPIREAFAELRRQGLVDGSEHRGVTVFRPTLQGVLESVEVQELVEGHCIASSAPELTDEDLLHARALLDEHRRIPVSDRRRGLELDTEFHLALLVRCANEKLRMLAETTRRDTTVHRLVLIPVDDPVEHLTDAIYEQHEAIFAACADRDGEAAAARTVEHIRWSRNVYQQVLG